MSESFDTQQFLAEKVNPHLSALGKLRTRALLFYGAAAPVFLLAAAIFFLGNSGQSEDGIVGGLVVGFVGLVLGFTGYGYQKSFREKYKEVVLKNLFAAVHPDFIYDPQAHITEEVYTGSRLFPRAYERYDGDDLVSGRIGKTDFCFSELHTQYSTTSTDSKGNTTTHWHTIFQGIFFHADFHKHFQGATYVLPDVAEAIFGKWLGQGLQSAFSGHGEIVKLESVEFEKAFVTFSHSQQEARYILSPSLMERMLGIRSRFECDTFFAFVEGRVYVAIATNRAHFEPSLFHSDISVPHVKAHLDLVAAVIGIIDDLNLNQRIWTKE